MVTEATTRATCEEIGVTFVGFDPSKALPLEEQTECLSQALGLVSEWIAEQKALGI